MTKKNEVLVFEEKGEFFTTSLDITEKFGKSHKNVLQAIEELSSVAEFSRLNFKPSNYTKRGKSYPCFNITRDGCALLIMGFIGKEALQWKVKYITAFNKLEKYVRAIQQQEHENKTNPALIQIREENRASNKDFNEALKVFVEYADKDETSSSPKRYYMVFNNMINHALFTFPKSLKNIPDKLSGAQLKFADSTKQAISDEIQKGIGQSLYYKDIFQNCKRRAFLIAEGLGVSAIPLMLE
jgi:Rha family phage regulatory protein